MTTGSLINNVLGGTTPPTPEVGMGATILMWTDRHACTIVGVSKDRKAVSVCRDNAIRVDNNGMSDSQSYGYTRNPGATIEVFTLRMNGLYVRKGDSMSGERLLIGKRMEYHDFSF